jgi:molecular chaperone DnaK
VVEVKATNGDTHLGGDDFDQRIIDWLIAEFKKDRRHRRRKTDGASAAEGSRREGQDRALDACETEINLPFITADADRPEAPAVKLTRAKLEQLVDDCSKRPMARAAGLADAGVDREASTRSCSSAARRASPKVQQLVQAVLRQGAAQGREPRRGRRDRRGDPGGVLAGEVKDMLLLDVTPLSLGVETLGGVMTQLIAATRRSRRARARSSRPRRQPDRVEVHVLQGERRWRATTARLAAFH